MLFTSDLDDIPDPLELGQKTQQTYARLVRAIIGAAEASEAKADNQAHAALVLVPSLHTGCQAAQRNKTTLQEAGSAHISLQGDRNLPPRQLRATQGHSAVDDPGGGQGTLGLSTESCSTLTSATKLVGIRVEVLRVALT